MTYNIYEGGKGRLPNIIKVIIAEAPDFLTINEANLFSSQKKLKEFSQAIRMPYCQISFSGEEDYHVAVFSKQQFMKGDNIEPLKRAGVMAVLSTGFGDVSFVGTHLVPDTERKRLPELDLIFSQQSRYQHKVLMGDMNSLSLHDGYKADRIKKFNKIQIRKFTENGKLCYNAVKKIEAASYRDTAVLLKKNHIYTAPTSIVEDKAHSDMRLDYIFVSPSLVGYIKSYEVVKNNVTEKASDHYPVTVTLKD